MGCRGVYNIKLKLVVSFILSLFWALNGHKPYRGSIKSRPGVYKAPYFLPLGERLSSCEEGKGISWLWGGILCGKKGKRKQYHLPYQYKYQVGKRGRGRKLWQENQGLR